MQQLYILRHGQTETNLRGAFTGQLDIPLTEEGKRQASGWRAPARLGMAAGRSSLQPLNPRPADGAARRSGV